MWSLAKSTMKSNITQPFLLLEIFYSLCSILGELIFLIMSIGILNILYEKIAKIQEAILLSFVPWLTSFVAFH